MSTITEIRKKSSPAAESAEPIEKIAVHSPIWRRRGIRLAGMAIVALVALILLSDWLLYRWRHVLVDDSRIAANLVTVSSEVSGRVTEVPIIVGDVVRRGDLLARIDRNQAELEHEAIEAQIAAIDAEQQQLRAQQAMIRIQTARKIEAAKAEVAAAEASHRASRALMDKARSHYDRIRSLAQRNIASQQDLEVAEADRTTAEQQERSSAARIETAKANLAVAQAQEAEIVVLERQIAVLEARKSAQTAERDRKRLDISHGTITAEFDGVVDGTFVDAGEYVSPGTRLIIYHDPKSVWVDANVKETDFRRLKVGAPARIEVDAYPDQKFTGMVIRLGEAVTSQFALLPSPNPSGNFTKITQRVPLRVSVDQKEGLLRPGMMVELSIDVVD